MEIDYALRLNAPNDSRTLWQVWLFLQRADIWVQQFRLVIILYNCFILSTLVDSCSNNFRQFRQKYRVSKALTEKVETSTTKSFQGDGVSESPLALRSQPFYDLANLLLEVAYQKSLYDQHQSEIAKARTVDKVKAHIDLLREPGNDVIPKTSAEYHEAIFECLALVVHRNTEGPDAWPIFDAQRSVMDLVLQPLRSSASSGFCVSRDIQGFEASDILSMFAKAKDRETSNRFSIRASAVKKLSSALDPRSNRFSRTHGLDGSVKKTADKPTMVWTTNACGKCKRVFPSGEEKTTHEAEKSYHCPTCRMCLSSGSRAERNTAYHREELRDARWSVRRASCLAINQKLEQ